MNSQSVSMRAKAMRLANILARVEFSPRRTVIDTSSKNKRELRNDEFLPPKFKDWPEINMDYLFIENADGYFLYDDLDKGPAVWPLDQAIVLPYGNGGLRLALGKTIAMRELRGKARRLSSCNAATYVIDIDEYGDLIDYGSGFFGLFAGKWTSLLNGGSFVAGCEGDRYNCSLNILIGAALAQRYEWSAIFLFKNGFKLRFGCSAKGALELFKDRDRPEEGRRKSLLHWVRRHWRQTSDPDTARAVRQHLRGITNFSWRGMSVSVIPAEFELEKGAF